MGKSLNQWFETRNEYLAGAEYLLCECEKSSMVFQRDIPNDQLMERLYERWIRSVEEAY